MEIDKMEIAEVVNTLILFLTPASNEYLLLPSQLRYMLKPLNEKYAHLGGHERIPISKIIYEDAVDFLTGSGWQQDHELRHGRREYFVRKIQDPNSLLSSCTLSQMPHL